VYSKPAVGLYGLSPDATLLKIDPQTFDVVNVGKPMPSILQSEGLASIDNVRSLFYFVGYDLDKDETQLISLFLENGTVQSTLVLPFESPLIVGIGNYCDVDPNTGDVIVTGRDATVNGDHNILRINPNTKKITPLNHIDDIDVLGGFSAYESIKNIEYIELYENDTFVIYGFNAVTGEVVSRFENTRDYYMESLDFDPKTGLLFGVGFSVKNDDNNRRTLLSLNGKTGEFKQLAVLPGYYYILGSESALDVQGRRLFTFLAPFDDQETFHLVGVNIDTGKILYAPTACLDEAECPWNIEYFSG